MSKVGQRIDEVHVSLVPGQSTSAGDESVAIIKGDGGVATVGKGGTAIAGVYGKAKAGDYSVAICAEQPSGEDVTAESGAEGYSIAYDEGRAKAGGGGVAISRRHGSAEVGERGIAISSEQGRVRGDTGALLICRYRSPRGMWQFATGVVDEDNFKSGMWYIADVESGELIPAK